MSTHEIPVVRVPAPAVHENADNLELINLWGFTVVAAKGQFKEGSLAVYVPPDFIVPVDAPEFAFLKTKEGQTHQRITVKRLRGTYSQGLLVPARPEFTEGQNVIEELGITRYEPPISNGELLGAQTQIPGPALFVPKYDLENLLRYSNVFIPGEPVFVTEKIHGANARYVYTDGQFWLGSRTQWKPHNGLNLWSRACEQDPNIEAWCRAHPDCVLFGEVYGQVQDLTYDTPPRTFRFAAFDIMAGGRYLNPDEFFSAIFNTGVYPAPILCQEFPFDLDSLRKIAEQDSVLYSGLKEGIVVRPTQNRNDANIGRIVLKLVSNRYLSRK